jgi:peptidoglycan/LPS O-acetylase OafA/YrhL
LTVESGVVDVSASQVSVPATARRPQLPALTGLRIFAALAVVAYHFASPFIAKGPAVLANPVHHGLEGVTLFFVLSGFILAYIYLERGSIDKRSFWVARFARIYPAFVVAYLVAAPFYLVYRLAAFSPRVAVFGFGFASLIHLGLLQAWTTRTDALINPPAWSLSAEAFFYATFPFIALPIARLRGKRLMALGVVCLAITLTAPVFLLLTQAHPYWGGDGPGKLPIYRLGDFVFGVVLGLMFLRRQTGGVVERFAVPVGGLLTIGLLLLPVSRFQGLLEPVFVAAFGVLILGLATQRGALASVLSWSPLVLLGEASYAVYLLQMPLANAFQAVLRQRWNVTARYDPSFYHSGRTMAVFVLLLILCSLASMRFIEMPSRKWIRARLGAPRPPSARIISDTPTLLSE